MIEYCNIGWHKISTSLVILRDKGGVLETIQASRVEPKTPASPEESRENDNHSFKCSTTIILYSEKGKKEIYM